MSTIVEKLNSFEIKQTEGDWIESLPEEVYQEFFVGKKDLASYLDVDKRRWYESAIDVFKLKGFDNIIGVRFVGDLFSETMSWEDAGHTLQFFDMEEVKTTTYKIKK